VVALAAGLALFAATGAARGVASPGALAAAAAAIALVVLVLGRHAPWLALALGAALVLRTAVTLANDHTVLATRSFFGVFRVERVAMGTHGAHALMHGSTLHGAQSLDPARRRDPQTYYLRSGPVGHIFASVPHRGRARRVAVVGLGSGAMAPYSRAGESWDFYEIDPGSERIARDTTLFTYLADSPARVRVLLGDGRLRMREAPDGGYDLILLDAFSSDAVPTHLLTREALALYLRKLAPGGVIAYHISNRYLRLEPVIHALGRDQGLLVLSGSGPVDPAGPLDQVANWTALARDRADLGGLGSHPLWEPARGGERTRVWTDDYSSVLSALDL
jgi:hypothetical protein